MIETRICKYCGKEFFAVVPNQIYCSKKCRLTDYAKKEDTTTKRYNSKSGQPCWRCQRACGRCSWSAFSIPVKGSKLRKGKVTYRITFCPKFIEDVD